MARKITRRAGCQSCWNLRRLLTRRAGCQSCWNLRILSVGLLIIAAALPASILHLSPSASPLSLSQPGSALPLNPPFPSPQNVEITLYPSSQQADSVRITWSPVPGATSYRVYTAISVEDSTKFIPVTKPNIMPDGSIIWEYLYEKHPQFGDPMFTRLFSTSSPLVGHSYGGPQSGTTALFSTFTPASGGRFDGCSYIYPLQGERDRFFVVTAVR